ncbi:FtsW/RodA/SpoVE family cell cycle protein [Candidatus Woesebacteria bacterium]|nr:FtsW/RodA/SpoVE family cell cycle protein [Candidatus Woesebacteria bacterium]
MRSWILPAVYVFLGIVSCITLSSVAPTLAQKQLQAFVLGGVLIAALSQLPFSLFLRLRWPLYILNILLLVLPLFVFASTRNTHRWIDIGGLTYQPSQTAGLLALGVILITLTSAREITMGTISKILLLAAIPIGLVFAAPDLGSAVLVAVTLLSPLFFVSLKWTRIVPFIVLGLLGVVIAWFFFLAPYQRERLLVFIGGEKTENYNAHQALIAVGSGELLGRGIGKGVQSHLRFLPERQTDFIFASFAEEFGFIGCSVLIGTYLILIIFLWYISAYVHTLAGKLWMLSTAVLFLVQVSINIHMNLGLLPITGVTLPFMSYGGSSIVALSLLLGINQQLVLTSEKKVTLHIT